MVSRPFVAVLAACVALSACNQSAENPSAPADLATPQPTATVVKVIEVPTPEPSASGPTTVEVIQQPTPCGTEKLQNYLNLLPTATAKEEIAKAVGHNRIRYIGLADAKASALPTSNRLTAGLGPDGRIKEFTCG